MRGGLNLASLSVGAPPYYVNGDPTNVDSKKSRTSFNAGVYGEYSFTPKIVLPAELFYSGEGVSFTNPGTEAPAHIELSYLSLPVFFKYGIIKNFYVMAGPQLSYLLAAHSVFTDGGSYNISNEHSKIVFGLAPAVGYDWKNFSINVRYSMGLSNITKPLSYGGNARYVDDNVKSNVFSVTASYKVFTLK
ncbi:MAG: PorT family protein [Bacteroidetes bacterium]|nr:PorT family protein [Bacteroidota bacterium]MBS1540750.1 PorT family protein [Bacteroidota bacterium]